MDLVPLHLLTPGQTGEVGLVFGDGDHVHRLSELGFRDGALVEMVQPGTPCIIRMGEQKLCFRGGELSSILVRVQMGNAPS